MRGSLVTSHALVAAVGVGGIFAGASLSARAASGLATIRLTVEREILLADGRSATTLTADVRDDRGGVVPDGTVVRFTTTAGRLDTTTATTRNGVARVTLTAADLPGTALVSASLEGGFSAAPAQRSVAFASDADTALTGGNWARIEGDYVGYAVDNGIIQANKKNKPARVTYRGAEITADALQVNIQDNTVRAAGSVVLVRGPEKREYSNLRYSLTAMEGVGERDDDGRPRPFQVRGPLLNEAPAGETPGSQTFAQEDISAASLVVVARSIALEPNVRLQFRRATFYLDGSKALSLPFHIMALGQESLFAEQVLGYGANGFSVDFPLYYDVRPSTVGTLHVRHGARVGTSAYSARPGWSLDLEHAYNGRSASDGTVEVTGLTRQDWGARWTHTQRLGTRSQGRLYVDFPNHSDLFVNTLLSRSFRGFSVNATAAGSRAAVQDVVGGDRSAGGDWRGQVYAETDPRALGGVKPLRYTLQLSTARQGFYGPSAPAAYNTQTAGMRFWTTPFALGGGATLTPSLSLGQTWTSGGESGNRDGASILGTLALGRRLGGLGNALLTYDYTQTPERNVALASGRHRLGASVFLGRGERWSLSLTGSHALDQTFSTVYGNLQFALGGPWRGRITLYTSRFSAFRYQDVEYALIRRIGGRDIAVYYSTTSRRFQFDLTGARF
jgi:hypothetical protein